MCKGRSLVVSLLAASLAIITQMPAGFALDEMDVRKAFIHETLLKCYLAKRMLPEAQREYQAVLKYKPNDARMHFDYGNCMLTMQNKAGALGQFKDAARIQPGIPEYWAAVGTVSMMLKNYQKELQAAQVYLMRQRQIQEEKKQLQLQNEQNKKIKDDDD